MAQPSITDAALTRIRQLVADATCARPVVVVIWAPARKDVKRGPNGETIWNEVTKAQWHVSVLDWDEPPGSEEVEMEIPTEPISGLEFYFGRSSTQPSLQGRTLDFRAGEFLVI